MEKIKNESPGMQALKNALHVSSEVQASSGPGSVNDSSTTQGIDASGWPLTPEPWELEAPKTDTPTAAAVDNAAGMSSDPIEEEATPDPDSVTSETEADAKVNGVSQDGFPLNLLPTIVTQIVLGLYQTSLFPIGYSTMAILFVVSILLGKGCRLITNVGQTVANLYIAFVGPKGEDKTRPIRWATAPLVSLDRDAHARYKREKKDYERSVASGVTGLTPPEFPRRYIMSNATDEAILKQLNHCPESIGLRQDELMDLLKQSGKYTEKGSDLYLSLHSGASIEVDRATKDEVYFIVDPFVSLIGGIQPDRFIRAFRGDRMDSGLFDRLLLVVRDGYTAKPWDLISNVDTVDIDSTYCALLHRLIDSCDWQGDYHLSNDAKVTLQTWQNEEEHRLEQDGSDLQRGVYRKMQVYAFKFAIILQILWDIDSGTPNPEHIVSVQNAIRATVLADYFYEASSSMAEEISPSKVNAKEAKLLAALPDAFTAAQGQKLAQEFGVGKTQYYHLLGILNGKVIEKTARGMYIRKYPGLSASKNNSYTS